jgi:hypothetical protein
MVVRVVAARAKMRIWGLSDELLAWACMGWGGIGHIWR